MKKILCVFATFIMLFFFLVFPEEALAASRKGLSLWFDQLLPALLPFSILSYVILQSNLFASRPSRRRRKIAAEEWYIILCGFLFGFPIGSKLTADLYREKKLSKNRALILFVFTNNLSPVFVTTVFREQLLFSPGIVDYVLLYGIPLLYGLLALRHLPSAGTLEQKEKASRFRLDMQIIDAGIVNGFETLIKICGYVVLFSLTAKLLHLLPLNQPILKTILIGCTEVTTGMSELPNILNPHIKYILGIGFLSWGGISGFFQTASLTKGTGLSMKRYLIARLTLAALALCGAALSCVLGIH